MSSMWSDPADDPRSYGNPVGELATLREYLANHRITLRMKCQGLDPEQLAARLVPPSTMSLLGLVRHMDKVENSWFRRVLGEHLDEPQIFRPDDDRDWDFTGAVADQGVVDEAFARWEQEIAAADAWVDGINESGLGREVPLGDDVVSIRDVLVHMIEEYARHVGHADLLRECIDGRTGQ